MHSNLEKWFEAIIWFIGGILGIFGMPLIMLYFYGYAGFSVSFGVEVFLFMCIMIICNIKYYLDRQDRGY